MGIYDGLWESTETYADAHNLRQTYANAQNLR